MIQHTIKTMFSLGVAFAVVTGFASVSAQQKDISGEMLEELVSVWQTGIATPQLVIAEVLVPGFDAATFAEQTPSRLPENYLQLTIAFNLAELQVVKLIRGQAENSIYIQNVSGFSEAYTVQPFTWQSGSRWVLLLESPFLPTHPDHAGFSEKLSALNTEDFLNPDNFFTVFQDGFGAACLSWPAAATASDMLPVVSPDYVADLQTILPRLTALTDTTQTPETEDLFIKRLKTPLGLAVYSRLTEKTADN